MYIHIHIHTFFCQHAIFIILKAHSKIKYSEFIRFPSCVSWLKKNQFHTYNLNKCVLLKAQQLLSTSVLFSHESPLKHFKTQLVWLIPLSLSLFKDFIYLILEREEGREKEAEREKQQSVASCVQPNRTHAPGLSPERESSFRFAGQHPPTESLLFLAALSSLPSEVLILVFLENFGFYKR